MVDLHHIGKTIVCRGPLCQNDAKTKGLCNAHYKQTLKGNELKPVKMRKYFPLEYNTWNAMKSRCNKVNSKDYANYGGRGIKVCERWDIFEYFLLDMGTRPFPSASLERIDNNKGYFLENCIWIDSKDQSKNRRVNVMSVEKAKQIKKLLSKKTIKEISKIYKCSYCTIWRISKGIAWK